MSSGSKPEITTGRAVVGRDELERPRADHGGDVPGADEAVEPQVGRLEQRAQRRHDRHVVADAGEVRDALGLRALERQRGRRARSSRSRSRRTRPRGRGSAWRSAARRAASRPSARRRPRPWPPAASRCEPGTRIMSPKQVKITPGSCAIAIPSSTRPIGITHTGQPGPWTSSTFVRQQVVDPVLVDRVGVPAAHLHHLVVAAGLDGREDLAGQRAAELGVAELVDELHAAQHLQRGPGVHEQAVAVGDRLDERDLDARALAVVVLAQRQRAAASTRTTRIAHRLVAAGDAAGRGRSRSLDHALPQLLELLLVVGAHALEQLQRGLAPPPRRPSRARSRRGSGPSRPAARRRRRRRAGRC